MQLQEGRCAANLLCVAAKLLAQGEWGGILRVCAANLDDVVPLFRFELQSRLREAWTPWMTSVRQPVAALLKSSNAKGQHMSCMPWLHQQVVLTTWPYSSDSHRGPQA